MKSFCVILLAVMWLLSLASAMAAYDHGRLLSVVTCVISVSVVLLVQADKSAACQKGITFSVGENHQFARIMDGIDKFASLYASFFFN